MGMLSWRLRVFGFMLMAAGFEVAFWQWQERLALFGGMFINYGMWAVALVGAGGFTAATAAVASFYYRPLAATVYFSMTVALFSALFGWAKLLFCLGCVLACMAL